MNQRTDKNKPNNYYPYCLYKGRQDLKSILINYEHKKWLALFMGQDDPRE